MSSIASIGKEHLLLYLCLYLCLICKRINAETSLNKTILPRVHPYMFSDFVKDVEEGMRQARQCQPQLTLNFELFAIGTTYAAVERPIHGFPIMRPQAISMATFMNGRMRHILHVERKRNPNGEGGFSWDCSKDLQEHAVPAGQRDSYKRIDWEKFRQAGIDFREARDRIDNQQEPRRNQDDWSFAVILQPRSPFTQRLRNVPVVGFSRGRQMDWLGLNGDLWREPRWPHPSILILAVGVQALEQQRQHLQQYLQQQQQQR